MIRLFTRRRRPPTSLAFRVGPNVYTLRVDARPVLLDGIDRQAIVESDGNRIRITADLPRHRRFEVLINQLSHAWGFQFGEPTDPERIAAWCGTVAAAAVVDLEWQGGLAALLALEPADREGGDQ